MEYSHDDAGLAGQPVGYWAWAASKSVVTHIRAALAEYGLTQPQWWVLHQASEGGAEGRDRDEVFRILRGYLDVGLSLQDEIDAVVARGAVTQDGDGRLRLSAEGEQLYAEVAERQGVLRKEIHDGIPDEEYVRTLKVLQRMIHNTGGEAWHH